MDTKTAVFFVAAIAVGVILYETTIYTLVADAVWGAK